MLTATACLKRTLTHPAHPPTCTHAHTRTNTHPHTRVSLLRELQGDESTLAADSVPAKRRRVRFLPLSPEIHRAYHARTTLSHPVTMCMVGAGCRWGLCGRQWSWAFEAWTKQPIYGSRCVEYPSLVLLRAHPRLCVYLCPYVCVRAYACACLLWVTLKCVALKHLHARVHVLSPA